MLIAAQTGVSEIRLNSKSAMLFRNNVFQLKQPGVQPIGYVAVLAAILSAASNEIVERFSHDRSCVRLGGPCVPSIAGSPIDRLRGCSCLARAPRFSIVRHREFSRP